MPCNPPRDSLKGRTRLTAKSPSAILDRDDPPRFTREMAESGRHIVAGKVIREARSRTHQVEARARKRSRRVSLLTTASGVRTRRSSSRAETDDDTSHA